MNKIRSAILVSLTPWWLAATFAPARANQTDAALPAVDESARRFEEAMSAPAARSPDSLAQVALHDEELDLLTLARQGGIFMYPIYAFSFVAALFAIERGLALRRRRVIPASFVAELEALSASPAGFDPRQAYQLCQARPSVAARVVRGMLLKTGRPLAEVEQGAAAVGEREANRLYNNVRPLNLAAAAAPLLGLLGTVQGMIMAFHATAHLPPGQNKAAFLARGVYVALVTTFAGLCVAIPAVCASHFLEGRIQRLFREIEDLVAGLLPGLERFEGESHRAILAPSKPSESAGEAKPAKPLHPVIFPD